MYLSALPATVVSYKSGLFLLTWVCAAYVGQTCDTHPAPLSVVTKPISVNILQGSNHTFFCKGQGTLLIWEVNNTLLSNIPENWNLKFVDLHTSFHEGCIVESSMTILAENSSMNNITTTYTVNCAITNDGLEEVTSELAYLRVYVIGSARDVQFALPVNSSNHTVIQWNPPYTSLTPSLLQYNITVIDDVTQVEVVPEETTMYTSYTIISDSLVPCDRYVLKVLPFQQLSSSHIEVGIETETTQNYTGATLPATNITSTLSMDLTIASAQATVDFQATFTECHLQWPKRFLLALSKEGSGENTMFQSTEVIVQHGTNMYLLEKLDLHQEYELFVKMMNEYSSSISNSLTISTFLVQDLSIEVDKDRNELTANCVMAEGAEGKQCTVEMRNGAGDVQDNCNKENDGVSASCNLIGLLPGEYMVWAYDEGHTEDPAVKVVFGVPEELVEISTSIVTTSEEVDDIVTAQTFPSGVGGPSTTIVASATSAAILVGLLVVILIVILLLLVSHMHRRKSQSEIALENSASGTVTYTYERDQRNEREPTPPPPIPTSRPPPIHRNPAYLSVTLKRTVPTKPLPNHATYEIVGLQNPAYQHVTPNPKLPSTPSAAM